MQKIILTGLEAKSLLEDISFLDAWDSLWNNCPWATVFQHREFVKTWFDFYSDYPPILVTDWNGETITGLITMTFFGKDQITAAGFDQAEYQTWLSMPQSNDEFIQSAIRALRRKFPGKIIHFKYIPSKTPLIWQKASKETGIYSFLKDYEQPLLALDRQQLEGQLKKKNRKEKINRLKRLGELQFNEIQTKKEFEECIDEMILQNDFRKGALYGKMIFQAEPQRKLFLLKMFEMRLLHVSILKLNNIVIASNAGFKGLDRVYLQGINSHSPFYSKYSPGILHFLMLGMHLSSLNFKYFDLTPGGVDGYKRMLSNTSEVVHQLWISNKNYIFLRSVKERFKKWFLLSPLKGFYISVKNLRILDFSKHFFLRNFFQVLFKIKNPYSEQLNLINYNDEKVYFVLPMDFENHESTFRAGSVKINNISDLFLFDVAFKTFNKQEFFADSLKRIELGNQLISVSYENKLIAVFWYKLQTGKENLENLPKDLLTIEHILDCSFYNHDFDDEIIHTFQLIRGKLNRDFGEIPNLILSINTSNRKLIKTMKYLGLQLLPET
jgi:CelD/BcsL family acetyltransferase involved in cellulose biosynthesis